MLKVVGASTHKTRIGTYILVCAGMLVIGAFFIAGMDRPLYDGTYCAYANWSEKLNYEFFYLKQQTDLVNIPKGVARICYKDSIYENGWAQLELETQRHYPDHVQAFSAGYLEGVLTWFQILNQWKNTMASLCDSSAEDGEFCEWFRETLIENYRNAMEKQSLYGDKDPYWHQIYLFYVQLEGLNEGYIEGYTRSLPNDEIEEITFADLLVMNSAADIADFKVYYNNFVLKKQPEIDGDRLPGSTLFLKVFKTVDSSGWRTLFGHTSAGSYSSMLRVHKRYKLRYGFNKKRYATTVHGTDISFTGYPAVLASTDDFYIIKGKKVHAVIAGVPIRNHNLDLWNSTNINIQLNVPLTARVMAANRLFNEGIKWAKYMARHLNTGSKQWAFVDLKKIESLQQKSEMVDIAGATSINGSIWICEQLPGNFQADYVPEEVLERNFTWTGNGVPYLNATLELSKVTRDSIMFPINIPTVGETTNLLTLDAVDKYLRNISYRGDLPQDDEHAPIPYGNIDIKLFSHNSEYEITDFYAFAGPVFIRHFETPSTTNSSLSSDSLVIDPEEGAEIYRTTRSHTPKPIAVKRVHAPFQWSKVEDMAPHVGHPDAWDFKNYAPKWAWHD